MKETAILEAARRGKSQGEYERLTTSQKLEKSDFRK